MILNDTQFEYHLINFEGFKKQYSLNGDLKNKIDYGILSVSSFFDVSQRRIKNTYVNKFWVFNKNDKFLFLIKKLYTYHSLKVNESRYKQCGVTPHF